MTDDTTTYVNNTGRAALALVALAFNAAIILYLIYYGKAENSLHASALAWSYATSIALLAGLGLGAALPTVLQILGAKK